MPGLLQRGVQLGHASATSFSASSGSAGSLSVSNTIWSKQREDLGYDQLRKFWYDLPTPARRELLRIDKQTLCEHARKNLYCSRCHGLLLECFSQIVMYGKSLQQEFVGEHCPQKTTADVFAENDLDNLQDASVHPWGGLATTKDGMLTLLDCFICASSPDVIYKVFNSARQREHDRELLYPDACGGGGRGWISHGLANFGRVHGARETCALHTSRLSCDTLLDFWSALGDETRSSLLHMKEDDFIERLMHRFDSKRFCRDCRRNVLREFKDLKELKRSRKELRCTNWFCAADTTILYEVSEDGVLVDWQHSFTETSTYHHFDWAIGTAEGKNDILDFEDVGMNRRAEVKGLNLSSLNACFITLRAWKLDGRCTELLVTAHALKGQACLHRSLAVADGFVTITKGDSSVRCFFRHAEKVEDEEEEDDDYDDSIDKDGDGSRPQRHAKSPELAREFLLDAATVIFKEQVEKAFREGTARQNSHSLFVSLAIKLLEDCVHVACKDIITLEKQMKLVEEEENEKRAEEERRERRRNKEREKKLRRKERLLKEKEKIIKDRELKLVEAKPASNNDSPSPPSNNVLLKSIDNGSLSTALNTLEPTSANTIEEEEEEEERVLSKGPQQAKSSSRRKLPFKRAALQNQAHRTTEASIKLKSSYRNASEYNNKPRDRFPISSTGKKLVCYSKRFFPNTNCAVVPKSKLVWEPISRADKETKYSSRNEAELSKKEEEEKPLPSAASPSSILIASSFDSSEGDNSRNEGASPSTSDSEDTCQPLDRRDASMGWARFSSDIPVHGIWPSPVGGGLPAFSSLRHSEGNSVQGHWVHGGNGREGAEPIKNCIGREERAFSLFHSGGPFVRSAGKSQEGGVSCCSMEETRVEEYTLFAANNTSNRFLFSSFTL